AEVCPRPPRRRGGAARLPTTADAGPALAGAGWFPGHLLLLGADYNGYAGRLAGPGGGRTEARGAAAGPARRCGRPPRRRHLPGIALPEVSHQSRPLRRLVKPILAAEGIHSREAIAPPPEEPTSRHRKGTLPCAHFAVSG